MLTLKHYTGRVLSSWRTSAWARAISHTDGQEWIHAPFKATNKVFDTVQPTPFHLQSSTTATV